MRDLRSLPKAELHIHLEGSIRVATIRELADRYGVDPPSALGSDDTWLFDGFEGFIDQYGRVCDLLRDLEDFRRIAYELCGDLANQGVRYAEAIFSPAQHARRLGDWFGPIEAVLDGLAAGERDAGVVVRLEPDFIRDYGEEEALGTLEVALKYAGRGVVAVNSAGSERHPADRFAHLMQRAIDAGLPSVPHAGEWAGPENVWETLATLRPSRIGHGVRSIEDPALVRHLADIGIPLEVCPSSNVATGVFASLEEHPFPRLREAGVVVTLNSDDPAMFGSWLCDEYAIARDVFGYGDVDLAEIARTGVRSSFADDALQATVIRDIDNWIAADDGASAGYDEPTEIVTDSM
jgi:adenosine deaminase